MVVKVIENINFPHNGWLSHKALGPQNGRYLLEIRGHSGSSSWTAGLLTIPEAALGVEEHHRQYGDAFLGGVKVEHFYHILPGTYEVQEGQDKRGQRLLRFYPSTAEPEFVLFHARGHIVQQASSPEIKALLECQGRSRTGRNGDRWGLFIGKPDSIVAIEPYGSKYDPLYYRITETGIEDLGATDAVLTPERW